MSAPNLFLFSFLTHVRILKVDIHFDWTCREGPRFRQSFEKILKFSKLPLHCTKKILEASLAAKLFVNISIVVVVLPTEVLLLVLSYEKSLRRNIGEFLYNSSILSPILAKTWYSGNSCSYARVPAPRTVNKNALDLQG